MACTGRYATAWEFSALSCPGNILKGQDRSGGGPNASLLDTQANFAQVKANQGYVLYNLTTGLSGVVTAVTATTLTATGVTWTNGALYRIALLSGVEIGAIESMLDIAASDMHVALAAGNACSCTFASWANAYLAKLNIIDAQVFYNCNCGNTKLSEEEKARLQAWVQNQLDMISNGKIELCSGETGSDFPSIGWAEQAIDDFSAARILEKV
jgi:hypothetical protein